MKLNIFAILIVIFWVSGCATKPVSAVLNEVLSRPESYNGKAISIEGFAYLDFETKLICSEREDLNQCLWLQIPESYQEIESKYKIKTGSKIVAAGVFVAKKENAKKNTKSSGVIYIQIRPGLNLLQKVSLTKVNG